MVSVYSHYWTITLVVLQLCPLPVTLDQSPVESTQELLTIEGSAINQSKHQRHQHRLASTWKPNYSLPKRWNFKSTDKINELVPRMTSGINRNVRKVRSAKLTTNRGDNCPSPCSCRNTTTGGKLIVDCSNRRLATIPENISIPRSAVELYLNKNNISAISADAFRNLISLGTLDLSENVIARMHVDSFTNLTNLKTLYLNKNFLKISKGQLPSNTFSPLVRLTYLDLKSNNIGGYQHFQYPDDAIGKLTSLKSLHINGVSNKTFGREFKFLTQLETLDLSESPAFQYIAYDMFGHLKNVPVKNLSLSNCNLLWIHPEAFSNLPNIDTINMDFNENFGLDSLGKCAYGLQNTTIRVLRCVECHSGKFTHLMADDITYIGRTNLEELYLDANEIAEFETECITRFPKSLQVISISWNYIQSSKAQMSSIVLLRNLRIMNASFQRNRMASSKNLFPKIVRPPLSEISSITKIALPEHLWAIYFSNTYKLRYTIPPFGIIRSGLEFVDISNNLLDGWQGPVEGVQRLVHLNLSGNECEYVSPVFFAYFTGLKELFIGHNKLGPKLNDITFYNLTSVEVLDMQNNRIEYVGVNLFSRLGGLQDLNLSHNLITSWDARIASLKNLTSLDLSNNRLSVPPDNFLDDLDLLQISANVTVTFKDNPLECNCETEYFVQWLTETHVKVSDLNATTCLLRNGTNMTLSEKQILYEYLKNHCRSYTSIIAGLSATVALILCVIVGRILHRYRWKLRYLYYMAAKRGERTGYERLDDVDQVPFVYDAFFSYEDSDRVFIRESLIPKLETGAGLKLCIDKRDFVPGLYVTDNIMNAIQHSKKTVVLLSNKFLQSKWCQYELNMARIESIYHGRDTLIVVMMETLTGRDLTPEVLEVVHNKSYIEKTDDPHGDDLFWRKLVTAIEST